MAFFRRRAGFTLIFVIVITAIIAVLFATAGSALISMKEATDAKTTWAILAQIDTGICGAPAPGGTCVATSFYGSQVAIGGKAKSPKANPHRVAELSATVLAEDVTYRTSCGTATDTLGAPAVTAWASFGPFIPFVANPGTANSIYTPLGFINDTLLRTTASGTAGYLQIRISGVTSAQAALLDQQVDGGDGRSSGKVQWNAPANDTTTLFYLAAIDAPC